MAVNAAVLQGGLVLASGPNVLCTAGTGAKTIVKRPVFANGSGSAVVVGINIIRQGVGGAGSVLVVGQSVGAGATWVPVELAGQVLNAGDQIVALASAGAAVTAIISGFTM